MEQTKDIVFNKELVKKMIGERKSCILEPREKCVYCGDCLICDLDSSKLCNNCGKCLDSFNTDEKGFVSIKIDKVIEDKDAALEALYKEYGLDSDDEQ